MEAHQSQIAWNAVLESAIVQRLLDEGKLFGAIQHQFGSSLKIGLKILEYNLFYDSIGIFRVCVWMHKATEHSECQEQ